MRVAALSALFVFLATPALADLEVRFDEGAPKDRFTITNTGGCALGATAVTIDLEGSPYGLIFDVTGQGAGVEVFQPFEVASGEERLKARPYVTDGDNQITLELVGLAPGEAVSFTIDMDDTSNSREITVSNQEMLGVQVVVQSTAGTSRAPFQEDATATVELSGCNA